jgi:uncharacterized protein (DUF433 family)
MSILSRLFGRKIGHSESTVDSVQKPGSMPQQNPNPQEVREPFNEVTTKDVTEAIEALFNKALYTLPGITPDTIMADYKDLKDAWASQALYSGTQTQMRGLVFHNLELLARHANFSTFIIKVVEDGRCAQISALYASTFRGIRLWRSTDRIFVCGSAGFEMPQDAVFDGRQLAQQPLDDLIAELIRIGQGPGYLRSKGDLTEFESGNNIRARDIGEELARRGGIELMRTAHAQIRVALGGGISRELEYAWDGIGGWLG